MPGGRNKKKGGYLLIQDLRLADIETTLATIAASPEFSGGSRLFRLLSFIIRHELDGGMPGLKAYTIATMVLGRGVSFDPAQDSIVRVEMARLRTALRLFYAEKPDVAVHIAFNKGSYKPEITRLSCQPNVPDNALVSGWARFLPSLRQVLARQPAAFFVLLAMFVGVATLAYSGLVRNGGEAEPPVLLVPQVKVTGYTETGADLSRSLTAELVGEISRFPWLSVVYQAADVPRPVGGMLSGSLRSVYSVNVDVNFHGPRFATNIALTRLSTGEIVWSNRADEHGETADVQPRIAAILRRAASDIAQPFGAVNKAETGVASVMKMPPGDYACMLKMRIYLLDYAPGDWRRFEACALELAGGGNTARPLPLALRAMVKLHQARWSVDVDREALLKSASDDAEAALRFREGPHLVLSVAMRSRACLGDHRGAEEIIARILKERQNNATALADVSHIKAFVLGDMDQALALAHRAQQLSFDTQRWHAIVPAMAALRAGDVADAKRKLGNVSTSHFTLGLVVGLAVSQPATDGPQIEILRTKLREAGLASNRDILGMIENECWTEDIKAMLRPRVMAALNKRLAGSPSNAIPQLP
jgi:TolB-like protein